MQDINQQLFSELIPKYQQVFFGENGLSMSEAGHRKNMIKENMRKVEADLDRLKAYTQIVDFGGGQGTFKRVNGVKEDIIKLAIVEGNYYALSAWLGEGIKAKEAILASAQSRTESAFYIEAEDGEFKTITMEHPMLEKALRKQFTENDILGQWTVKERAEYLTLESKAAHLGKKLHHGGIIAEMRDQLLKFEEQVLVEIRIKGVMDSFIAENTKLYTYEELDAIYMELQDKHRSWEQKLNWYKAKIKNDLNLANQQSLSEYNEKQGEFNTKYQAEMKDYNLHATEVNSFNQKLTGNLERRKLAFVKYLSALKIVLPEDLQPISDALAPKKAEENK